MVKNTPERPRPVDFEDYREFLREMVRYLKQSGRGFSYRQFARRAGFATSNFLKLVEQGKRNLSDDSIEKFAKGLGLTETETRAFRVIVMLGQADTDEARNEYYRALWKLRRKPDDVIQLEQDHFEVYSLWYAIPIRELMMTPEFQEDPKWIARQFVQPVKPSQVEKALELLQRTGLAARDSDGRLRPAHVTIKSPPTITSLAARNYHRSLLKIGSDSLDGVPKEKRNVTSLTLTLNREDYEDVCNQISDFRRKLLEHIDSKPADRAARQAYAVSFLVIPLTGDDLE